VSHYHEKSDDRHQMSLKMWCSVIVRRYMQPLNDVGASLVDVGIAYANTFIHFN
jgi:hypothetical protein